MRRRDGDVAQLRVPPCSIEAEQAVLGGIMLTDGQAAREVADLLVSDDFYRRDHQLIWQAIIEQLDGDHGIDAVTLSSWFEERGLLDQVQGGAYLIELASTTPSAANIRGYAEIVRDRALLRAGIEVGTAFVNDCFQPNGRETEEILTTGAGAVASILSSRGGAAGSGLRLVRGHLKGAWDDLQTRYNANGVVGLPLPWGNVAPLVPALEPGDLMYLAARPSMGKTALAMQAAIETAIAGKAVGVFSIEMSAGQLSTRGLSYLARVPMDRLRDPKRLEDEDWSRLNAATRILRDLPLAIDDDGAQTIHTIVNRAQRMHKKVEGGLGLVVVDYVQLIEGTGGDDKRNEELTVISRGLKRLAKQLRCPVLALSQLNRGLEARPNKRPIMADLRESGALEQDGDVIAFIYRDGYYSKEACGAPDATELIIGKNRNGPTGTAYLRHDLACSRFDDYQGRPIYTQVSDGGEKAAGRGKRPRGYGGKAERELPEDASP